MRVYRVRERSGFSVLMRVHQGGEYLTQAAATSITWKAFPEASETAVSSGSLTVADAVYDELQADVDWTEDAVGYNVRHDVGADVLLNAGRYRFEYLITPTTGAAYFTAPVIVEAEHVYTT